MEDRPADQVNDQPTSLADAAEELRALTHAAPWYMQELQRRIDSAALTLDTVSLADLAATIKRDRREWDIFDKIQRQPEII